MKEEKSGRFENTRGTDAMCKLVDDRTLHELYLWPFAAGVKAGTGAVMAAYNAVSHT